MSEVTRILTAIEQGDAEASEELLPLVYHELRRMADVSVATARIPFVPWMRLTP